MISRDERGFIIDQSRLNREFALIKSSINVKHPQ